MKILPKSFYDRDTVEVARDLLGKYLVREYEGKTLMCRIMETEAYDMRHPLADFGRGEEGATC